ncbi:DUF3265 domain-containing protein [Vibrio parahaemolyticus]|nr:DUF3265 domain-containing protein [Vibrio parahaemolyticus]
MVKVVCGSFSVACLTP